MVARTVRQLSALIGATLAAVIMAGCAADLGSAALRAGVDPDAIVRLDETRGVAARRNGSSVEVVSLDRDGDAWTSTVLAGDEAGLITAHLVSMGGDTGDEWNAFLFGTAPADASRVIVDGFDAAGGRVSGGAWVIAFRQKDLRPDQLSWRMLDATGLVIESGEGISP